MSKTKKSETDGQSRHEAVRLDAAIRARVDAEEARLRAANPTLKITRSDTLRSLLLRGLDAAALGAGGPVAVKGEV